MLCDEQEGAKRNVFPGGCEYGHTKSVTLVIITVESQWRYLLKQTSKKKLSLICRHEIVALIMTLQFYNEKRLIMSEKGKTKHKFQKVYYQLIALVHR
jgi:hypothetical protein